MVHHTAALTAVLAIVASGSPASLGNDARDIKSITSKVAASGTSFWYANMDHTSGDVRGYAPDLEGDYTYPVYVAVNPGDGNAIQDAIDQNQGGQRKSQWWASQTRVVYLPPGTYEVGSQIKMRTGTILMGDATNPPTIKASRNFGGERQLIKGFDQDHTGTGELSFTIGLKNVIIDTTNVDGNSDFKAINWRVAQGSQMQNVKIVMPTSGSGNGHTGIWVGQGSSLGVSDVRIERGWNGIFHNGHQQMAYKNINFFQNTNGLRIDGGDTISLTGSTFDTVGNAVIHTGGSPWIAMIDCKSVNSGVTFSTTQYPSLLIENLEKDTQSHIVVWNNNDVVLRGGPSHIDQFTYANTYGRSPIYGPVSDGASNRPGSLVRGGKYPSIVAPNYSDKTTADFINIKDPKQNGGHKVLGDHSKDESGVLNQILAYAAQQGKIAYFPFGKYRVDSTLFIPPGTQIVGEAWSTIMGSGEFFSHEDNPKPVVSVGKSGDRGIAHIQDMRITVAEPLAGAILVQINMAGNSPGDVAIWNSLIIVGGTAGSKGINDQCGDASNQCKGAFLGLHFTKSSSAYVENTWVWVADHNSEGGGGCNIAGKGGVLVQATKGTWLHALGSEHWWLYQLNLWEAQNVFVSMLQAETNYDQGSQSPQFPPAPWKANVQGWNDPDFSWCGGGDGYCRKGYSNFITGGSGIRHYASAAWDFFRGPGYNSCDKGDQDPWRCTNVMHWISKQPSDLQIFGICSKSAYNALRLANGQFVRSQSGFTGGWPGTGADLGVYKA
ncbi:hypothetical protein QQS21_012073 [Conoideocrella luteorostrata]|uniref:Rhamnogalacturonase A/B/Epimerase-like pectate lyase domain-containing protein n=1 Tax=Conoideocrella luteorostrata TaxID=1105319 RepID=A0AAJ0CEL8_9HYPO|nr:hypothetical protein QQS21_012073 [Conoideocrella luteorostrata]